MRVSISGSRTVSISFADIERYLPSGTTTIISGGALGVDTMAESYAREHGLEVVVIRPSFTSKNDRIAPLLRNTEIVSQAEYCLFFWDGVSKGTSHTISEARRLGKSGRVVISGLVSHSFVL